MLKKVAAIAVLVLFVFSCANNSMFTGTEETQVVNGSITNAENANVQLVKAVSHLHQKYGMSQQERSFIVKIKNISYQKHLTIYSELADGTWVEILALEYQESIPGDYELWRGFTSKLSNLPIWGDEFVVRYLVNGVEYWDNNDGQNYSFTGETGSMLTEPYNVLMERYSISGDTLNGSIDLRNIAYDKSVNVVYTTDNWQTTKVKAAYYTSYYIYGYSYVQSPNAYGIERWTFAIDISNANNVQFVIAYDVDGQTYWDNNFGKNYTISK